jgi:O-antigen/teichoic acid export membrane protein
MSGRSSLNFLNSLGALVTNVVLDLVLIPPFGLMGAAVAWSVAVVGVNVVRAWQTWRLFGVTPFSRVLWKPLAAAAAGGVSAFAVRTGLGPGAGPLARILIAGTAFASIYAGSLMFAGFEPDDRVFLRTLVGKAAGSPSAAGAGA